MFQIATTISHAADNNFTCTFPHAVVGATPTPEERRVYELTILRNVAYTNNTSFASQKYTEQGFEYSKLPALDNAMYEGYFQSHKHFEHNRNMILDFFSPTKEIENYISQKYAYFLNRDDTVSVSVRRGDYTTEKYKNHHGLLPKSYYEEAMAQFPDDHIFLFFSDDVEWCKSEFGEKDNFLFVEDELDVVDLYLISKMRNNIIANSTFPWWGAWLSQEPNKKVIAPKQWFGPANSHLNTTDLYPDSWIQI
jgi:hypothetical protein